MIYSGGCHCGAVRFEVDAEPPLTVIECNCSICTKAGYWHLIVPLSRFRLVAGAEALTAYTFNTHIAQHTFCKTCGIKAFYTPRSNPDGIDVNVRCFDERPIDMTVEAFDGADWDANAASLGHLSR